MDALSVGAVLPTPLNVSPLSRSCAERRRCGGDRRSGALSCPLQHHDALHVMRRKNQIHQNRRKETAGQRLAGLSLGRERCALWALCTEKRSLDTPPRSTPRAQLKPLLFGSSIFVGGSLTTTAEVENFPGFPTGIDGPDLMDNMRAQAEHFGAEMIDGDIISVDLTGDIKTVTPLRERCDRLQSQSRLVAHAVSAVKSSMARPHRGSTRCSRARPSRGEGPLGLAGSLGPILAGEARALHRPRCPPAHARDSFPRRGQVAGGSSCALSLGEDCTRPSARSGPRRQCCGTGQGRPGAGNGALGRSGRR